MTVASIPVPPLGPPVAAMAPDVAERTLDTGLRVVALRRSSVPLVELRLRIPFPGRGGTEGGTARAHAATLTQTLTSGTATRSNTEIAAALQELGGDLNATVDSDRLLVSGNALVSGLPRLLALLADVLQAATYPAKEVVTERDRLADRYEIAAAQPAQAARKALLRRVFGAHPYSVHSPEPDQVRAVEPGSLCALHDRRIMPTGAVLVLVGDLEPAATLDAAAAALGGWASSAAGADLAVPVSPVPPLRPGPLVLVDRPGSVQSSVRLGLAAVGRAHEDYPAFQLANLVFGGYFSSRLTENIREDKGYTYSPHATIEHGLAGSMLSVDADVATEVTAAALVEINYELGRIATVPVSADELENARQYAIGTLALSLASQSGLAATASALLGGGLSLDWLMEHPRRLAATTLDQVYDAAARYLGPAKAVTVVLGDAATVEGPLGAVTAVSRE